MTSIMRSLRVRPVWDHDADFLYRVAVDPPNPRLRSVLGGVVPAPGAALEALWQNCAGVFVVESEHHPLGFFRIAKPRFADGHAVLEYGEAPGLPGFGELLLLRRAFSFSFQHWPFRKLYVELPGQIHSELRPDKDWMVIEAVIPGGSFIDGAPSERVILAGYRDDCRQKRPTRRRSEGTMLSFDDFREYLAAGIDRPVSDLDSLDGEDRGGFDSAELLEMFMLIEDLGVELDLETALEIQTLKDLYNTYRQRSM